MTSLRQPILPHDSDDEEPAGRTVALWMFFLLGNSILAPWNAFVTAIDYFKSLYPAGESKQLTFLLGVVYNGPQMLLLILFSTVLQGKLSLHTRVLGSLVVYIVVIVNLPLLGYYHFLDEDARLYVTYTFVFLTGAGTCFLQGSLVGLAAKFPFAHMSYLVIGAASGGTVIGSLRLIVKATIPNNLGLQAIVYFSCAAVLVTAAGACFIVLRSLPFSQQYLHQHPNEPIPQLIGSPVNHNILTKPEQPILANVWRITCKLYLLAPSVCSIFFVTLALFPGVVASLKENQNQFKIDSSWYTEILVFIYLCTDTLGRLSARLYQFPSKTRLWIPCLLRFAFFPLFFITSGPTPLFKNDWFDFVNLFLFGFTSGYYANMCMMNTGSFVEREEKELAGLLMTFFLVFGLFLGSLCAVPLQYWHPAAATNGTSTSAYSTAYSHGLY